MTGPVRPGLLAAGVVLCLLTLVCPPARGEPPFPALYPDPDLFTAALAGHSRPPLARRVTGLAVPHHLLAVDLLAGAFSRLAGQDYRRVVILGPDHYARSPVPFAVAVRDFATCLGPVPADGEAVARLLACPLVAPSNLFAREHAVQALTPFLARFFPEAKLVAVAIRKSPSLAQLDTLAAVLAPLLDDKTLLVQSTDFSHYRTPSRAAVLDQQTLRLLADPDPRGLLTLDQPGNVDCRGALYLQRKLQQDVYRADPVTVANRNSQAYAGTPVIRSTSYLVQYYSPDPSPLPGPGRFVFAGDAFFGRFMARLLARPGKRRELVALVREATGGAPLVVNLEGVLAPRCPKRPGPWTLCMPEPATLALLRDLGVVAVGVANNHARDLGPAALARMQRRLGRAGIAVVAPGTIRDMGRFSLAALTDLDNAGDRRRGLLTPSAVAGLARAKKGQALFVMVHWGEEFAGGPGGRERELAAALRRAGAELVIGAHPHQGWPVTADKGGVVAWSLGNFLFDQPRPEASGSLLEVRFFPQGTYALRAIPLGNAYARLLH